ncbi:MAG: hypothetical protein O9339_20670 [Rubrivivax sp.]|jgi:hypothetical protein|nr:hypothetical protein [Rubrivivax sp.]
MTVLSDLAPFVPLAGTFLWVILIVGLVAWFNTPLRAILGAVHRRIEAGSTVKAGWFELSDQLRPQSQEQQRERAKIEIAEVVNQQSASATEADPAARAEAASLYLQAEDLALRAVQAEFEIPLNRQVTTSGGAEFDAAFVKDRNLHVVEVKTYLGSVSTEKLRLSLARVATAAKQMGGPQTRLIVAVVLKRSDDMKANRERIELALRELPLESTLRVYSLPELRSMFLASSGDA